MNYETGDGDYSYENEYEEQEEILEDEEQEVEDTDQEDGDVDDYEEESSDDNEDSHEGPIPTPPSEFDSVEDELSFYRENYGKVLEDLSSEEFANKLREHYADVLAAEEQEYEEIKKFYSAVKSGDKAKVFREYAPELLSQYINSKVPSENEIYEKIQNEMAEIFGEDYADYYNEKELLNPNSDSYKMKKYLDRRLSEEETTIEQMKQDVQVPYTKDELYERFTQNLSNSEIEYEDEEIEEMFEELYDYQPSVEDIYVAKNMETFLARAYREGIEEGKKASTKELRQLGQPYRPKVGLEKENKKEDFNVANYFSSLNNKFRGM